MSRKQVRDHALRQVVGLDQVVDRELLQLRHQAPVAADGALDQPGMRQVVEAARAAVALAGGVEQGEVLRPAGRAGEIQRLERDRDLLGEADADEAAGRDRVAAADQADRLGSADDLAVVHDLGRAEAPCRGTRRSRCGESPFAGTSP
jgi:hypothetical protein